MSGSLAVSEVPKQWGSEVRALGVQYCEATEMPVEFDVFEDFPSEEDGFLVLGIADGHVWGVAVASRLVAPSWGLSERLLVDVARRGQGWGTDLKRAQVAEAGRRGWQHLLVRAAGGHAAARVNLRLGAVELREERWLRPARDLATVG